MPQAPGREPRFNLRCTSCGYGVLVRIAPDRCPMCGGATWEHAGPELLERLLYARVRGSEGDVRALFRHLNEEIAELAGGDELELVCECDDGRCFAAVRLSRADFRALQEAGGRYVVLPGHELAGDDAIAASPRALVVGAARPVEVAPAPVPAEVEAHGRSGQGRRRQ